MLEKFKYSTKGGYWACSGLSQRNLTAFCVHVYECIRGSYTTLFTPISTTWHAVDQQK